MQRVLLTLQKTELDHVEDEVPLLRRQEAGCASSRARKPILITARLVKDSAGGEWTLQRADDTRRCRPASWKVSAYGVDTTGAFGNSATTGASLSFTVKK